MDTEKDFNLNNYRVKETPNTTDTEKKERKKPSNLGCYTSLPRDAKESLYSRFDNKGIGLKWVLFGMFLLSDTEFKDVCDKLEHAHTRNNDRLRKVS